MYGIQRAELFPSVNTVGAGGKQRRSADLIAPDDSRTMEQYGVNLGITAWEIDFFGRIRSLKDQALEAYLATEQARRSAQIALVSEVARTYLTLAADRENLKLAQSTLVTQQDSYELIQKSYQFGLSTQIDLRRAQTQVDAARRVETSETKAYAMAHCLNNRTIGNCKGGPDEKDDRTDHGSLSF